jgi:hypothetical protein
VPPGGGALLISGTPPLGVTLTVLDDAPVPELFVAAAEHA